MTLPAARAECTSSYNGSGRIAISARDHRIVRRWGSDPHSRCSLGWVLERGGVRAARLVQGLRLVLIRVARGASRPEEFHPRPLTERCGSLSAHTAPTKQPTASLPPRSPPVASWTLKTTAWPNPFAPAALPAFLARTGWSVPCAPHRYARLVVVATWTSPLASERQVPAVPHESPDQTRASSTPVAIRPVSRCPAD